MCVGLAASELCTSQALTQMAPARERVDTDNAFAVVQVGRCMPSGLLGGGRSLKETSPASPLSSDVDDDDADNDPELAAAIAASLVPNSAPLSADAMRQARLARFG